MPSHIGLWTWLNEGNFDGNLSNVCIATDSTGWVRECDLTTVVPSVPRRGLPPPLERGLEERRSGLFLDHFHHGRVDHTGEAAWGSCAATLYHDRQVREGRQAVSRLCRACCKQRAWPLLCLQCLPTASMPVQTRARSHSLHPYPTLNFFFFVRLCAFDAYILYILCVYLC